jgi:RNA polymerase sigma-70 factor (ECF subfamily)
MPEYALDVAELFRAIAALPADAAHAVVAVDVVGLSYAEAASLLRIKEATLTTRLHRARRRVARSLETEEARL